MERERPQINHKLPQQPSFYIERSRYLLENTPINSPGARAYFNWLNFIGKCIAINESGMERWQGIRLSLNSNKHNLSERIKEKFSGEYKAASRVLTIYAVQMSLLYEKNLKKDEDSRMYVLRAMIGAATSVYGKEAVQKKLKKSVRNVVL